MIKNLAGEWQLRQAQGADALATARQESPWLKAHVPGCVHTDLMAADRIPDPFHAFHENEVQWVAAADWLYRRTFDCPKGMDALAHVELVCDGLDTCATVFLNGQKVGRADNMFRPWRWDVKELLKSRHNELLILLESADRIGEQRWEKSQGVRRSAADARNYVRKAQYMRGWDWGPVLSTCGIWKGIRLEGCASGRLSDVCARVDWSDPAAPVVKVEVEIDAVVAATADLTVKLTGGDEPLGVPLKGKAAPGVSTLRAALPVPHPKLWWPNGAGPQHLYELTVEGRVGDDAVPPHVQRIGLRRVELVREKDEEGESFVIHVNDTPIFCKGADWIPADSFPTRLARGDYEALVGMAADANMNMLRVWGGGFYEADEFYECCDRLGIMVWQDFMFACSSYPDGEDWFMRSVRGEAEQTVRRLRNHASIVLWCGNNECQWHQSHNPGGRIYSELLPDVCAELDPTRPYWPGSPFGGEDANDPRQGNQHFWDPWHGDKGAAITRDYNGRFISEFGFMAPPHLDTIRKYAPSSGHYMQSLHMEHRNRGGRGTKRMHDLLMEQFRLPSTFADTVYLMQLAQAEAVKTAVEHWRSRKFATAGALFWQFNDCWPASSWSCLDYEHRPKALYHYAKRFFAPLLPTIGRRGNLFTVRVVNDLPEPFEGELVCGFGQLTGDQQWVDGMHLTVPANCVIEGLSKDLGELDVSGPEHLYFWCRLLRDHSEVARNVWLLLPVKHAQLEMPEWELHVEKAGRCSFRLEVRNWCFARGVWLHAEGVEAAFGDNFFDVLPEVPVRMTVRTDRDMDAEELHRRLRVRSVAETL